MKAASSNIFVSWPHDMGLIGAWLGSLYYGVPAIIMSPRAYRARHRPPAAAEDPTALEIVACGQPLPGHQVRMVDDTGREAPERHEGRLQFKGPSVACGYFENPEKNRTLFNGDWADSGDLAYIAEGDTYLTGRVKDVIIHAGRNVYQHELEECVGNVAGVRKGRVALIAGTGRETGTEKLIVVAETRLTDAEARADLETRILEASASIIEIPSEEIVLVSPHAVPKTSSGKIRRLATRDVDEPGTLGQPSQAVWWQLGRLTMSAAAGRVIRGGVRMLLRLTGSAFR